MRAADQLCDFHDDPALSAAPTRRCLPGNAPSAQEVGFDPGFGGTSFDSDGISGDPKDAHSNYWDEGNPARDNMAKIFTGNGDQVT